EVLRACVEGGGDRAGDPPRGAPRAPTGDQRRVLLGGCPAGDRPADRVLSADVRRLSRGRVVGPCPRTGFQQPPPPPTVGVHRPRAPKTGTARRAVIGVRRRNLGAAGLGWFLLIAGGVTAYWAFQPIFKD